MNFTDLVNEVYTLTNRPDLVNETISAIKSATIKAHTIDYFWKDLFETGLSFTLADYTQSFQYRMTVPRWRAIKYLRKFTDVSSLSGVLPPNVYTPVALPPSTAPGSFLTILTPDQVVDEYGSNKLDVCYGAGDNINIKTSDPQQYFLLACYLYPSIDPANYISWIATDHPYAIVNDAVATVFKATGLDEQYSAYQKIVAVDYQLLQNSNVLVQGY